MLCHDLRAGLDQCGLEQCGLEQCDAEQCGLGLLTRIYWLNTCGLQC